MKNIKQTNNFITNKKREQMTFKLLIEKKNIYILKSCKYYRQYCN